MSIMTRKCIRRYSLRRRRCCRRRNAMSFSSHMHYYQHIVHRLKTILFGLHAKMGKIHQPIHVSLHRFRGLFSFDSIFFLLLLFLIVFSSFVVPFFSARTIAKMELRFQHVIGILMVWKQFSVRVSSNVHGPKMFSQYFVDLSTFLFE